ncbi:MAG TPA: Gfo/Idh/MocA family oxidoreductase [Kouleothrix sp.]|uniref:Gfo/Idh/MocA family protein n=1 Tax=Kouleothrix sp. TaxID=2779161 RepID=UPI002D13976B|nr:Gfo/Idh/MocA family oxidoreductase [Kouleothrix sp.]
MSEQKVRWGVISTANIGRRAILPAIRRSHNGVLVAVGSRDLAKARAFAHELDIPRAYGSYEEVLNDPEVEAIYIPLPNSLHREWAIRAAEAGKHVLCEKPLGLDAAECFQMEVAARAHDVLLMEAFMYRFHPQTARVRELIAAGTIGKPQLIRASFSFRLTNPANIRLNPELGGGSLMDVGCYCVNVARTLFQSEPTEAQASAEWSASGVDELMVGSMRFPGGRWAQFDCALTIARREAYQVIGDEGYIDVPIAFLPGTVDTQFRIHDKQGLRVETIDGVDEYQLMVEHFADCVRNGNRPRYSAGEAAANMRAIAALYQSARNGGRLEVVASQ